jgi:hypothetical protein
VSDLELPNKQLQQTSGASQAGRRSLLNCVLGRLMRSVLNSSMLVLLTSNFLWATGWLDYKLDIGGGFAIYRANAFDISLGGSDGSLLICPSDFPGQVGPLREYAITDSVVATRHSGVRPHPDNPSLPTADDAIEWFFLVKRASPTAIGPMTRAEFARLHPSSLAWVRPSNPNFWRPVFGTLYFLALSALILGWPVGIAAAMISLAGFAWWRLRRRQREAA